MTSQRPLEIVRAWQDAANIPQIERLLDLSDPNIEIVGPRGTAQGHRVLREWIGRAGLQLHTIRAFARDDSVVLQQHGVWRSVETGAWMGEADLATAFRVRDGRVVWLARNDRLDHALELVGLNEADEVLPHA